MTQPSTVDFDRRSALAAGVVAALTVAVPAAATMRPARRGLTIETHVASAFGMLASSHLLLSGDEAVLVDATFLKADSARIADMIARWGRRLTRVLVTHAHPDHFLGAATLRARFPKARFIARPKVASEIAAIHTMATSMMGRDFGVGLDTAPVIFEPFTDRELKVGNETLPLIDFEGGESHDSLVVLTSGRDEALTGDILYAGAHLYLADRDADRWRKHLDALDELRTRRARPGHGRPGFTPALIATTRRYIDAFEREAGRAADAGALTARMKALYPGWAAERLLDFSAAARFPRS